MEKIIKDLNYHYYISFGVLAFLFILALSGLISFVAGTNVGVIAERYSIGLTLIAIPVALKLFADILRKHPSNSEQVAVEKVYKKASLSRLYILNVMTFINIILYAISHNMNFVWLTVVLFIVYIFCKPSHVELESLMIKEEGQENNE